MGRGSETAGSKGCLRKGSRVNHLVFLDARAGELEKILSGIKTMLVKEFDPNSTPVHPVDHGDSLYFLKDWQDCLVRVKAEVVQTLSCADPREENPSIILKEMQPWLQLTEDQYNFWSVKAYIQLVEFKEGQKIGPIQILPHQVSVRLNWVPFETFGEIEKSGCGSNHFPPIDFHQEKPEN
jgi:hypothetical protein